MSIDALVGLLIAVLVLAGLLGGARPYIRASATKATIELQKAELEAERSAREAQAERHDERIREMERRHAAEVGELRGKIDALQIVYAKAIAKDVAREVVVLVREELLNGR